MPPKTFDANSNAGVAQPVDANDAEVLLAKYREEREKRLRADGSRQFQPTEGAFAHYVEDQYAAPGFTREAVADVADVVIVGGGLGGLLIAARLADAGVKDVRIIEKGGDFGGTWYWNRYPGAACDVESYIYMPLLEELGYMPREKYARSSEIFAHCQAIGRAYDLYPKSLFQTEVTEMRWLEAQGRWLVSTQRGDAIEGRFVCISVGPLDRPKLPAIPGIENFRGHSFHTSRWDYGYTGGDAAGKLTKLADRRIGVIGTGATAIQCVPELAVSAKHLYVFQRTPSAVDPRGNRPTDEAWARKLAPGWQRRRMDNFAALISGVQQQEDLVNDGWTEGFRQLAQQDPVITDPAEVRQRADLIQMNRIRGRVDAIVRDKRTAEALKPYYNWFCKRPCFHDAYLDSFNRSNVTLVDTKGRGPERIGEAGVVVQGIEYEVDCLIYATGFEVGTRHVRRVGFEIYGRDGLSQSEAWGDGIRTLQGMHSRGFPNRFILSNAQSAAAGNYTHLADEVSRHLAYIIKYCMDKGIRSVEPTAEAERAWVDHVLSFADGYLSFAAACTPGYLNDEGQASRMTIQNSPYLGGQAPYMELLRQWREKGDLAGLHLQ
jgi:cyclohexanone monooxygenase